MAATRPVDGCAAADRALSLGAGALCAPAPAGAADPLARVSIGVKGAIPGDEKKTARMVVRDDGRRVYRGRIGIELRGQSSQRFPKQSWSIELRDRKGDNRDVSLLGMPDDDDWVLYARLQRQDADAQRARLRDRAARSVATRPARASSRSG